MKWTILYVTLLGLSCNYRTDKTANVEKLKTIHIDSLRIDSSEISGAGGQLFRDYHNCNFDKFISDKKTPKLAKDIYLDKEWDLKNDYETLALLDSLTSKNKNSRPFYFKVTTKSYKKSDGYFSEALGLTGKEYVENYTREFISHFDNKDCFTDYDLTTWAHIVILEFSIIEDGNNDKSGIEDYIKKLKSNCKACTPEQIQNINKFSLILIKEWKAFLNK